MSKRKKLNKKNSDFIPVSFDMMVSHLASKAEIISKDNYDKNDQIHNMIINKTKFTEDMFDDKKKPKKS